MISRHLLKLLTLTSLLPLASCATPDENPEGANVSPLSSNSEEPNLNNAKLNASIESAAGNNANDDGGNADNLLLDNEEDDGAMADGDADFDEQDGDLAAGPAANAGAAIEGFENNVKAENFINNPAPSTANVAAANAAGANASVPSNEAINSFKSAPAEQNAFAGGNIS